jgi:hypothetical protein
MKGKVTDRRRLFRPVLGCGPSTTQKISDMDDMRQVFVADNGLFAF